MPDFLSGLGQALTAARTGQVQGQNALEQEQYQRALQAQLLANQEEQRQWQRSHGDTGDLLKLLGIQGTLTDKGIGGAPATIQDLKSHMGGAPAIPASPPVAPVTPVPVTSAAPVKDTTFADIASGGAAPPTPQEPAAPPPPKGLTLNPAAGNTGANRQNKLQVAQKVQKVTAYTPDGKEYTFTYNPYTSKGLAPAAVIGMKSASGKPIAAGDSITVSDLPAGTKPTAQTAAGAVPQDERLIWQEASKELKPLQDDAIKFVNAASALKSAENKNPVAYASALSKFVQATEQSTNLRQGLLFYFRDNLRPDVSGKLQLVANRLADGSYPPEVTAEMKQHVADMAAGIRAMYETRWNAFAAQSPLVQRAFPTAETIFGKAENAQRGGSPSAPSASQNPEDIAKRNASRAKLGLPPLPTP